ncbi:hypothetical protein FF38_07858 [Lucilia cuprina]|uniref:Uncharacterized protein n=1 Tax=Lucilia cuprina TaxID=7375 RepID=A0A0L0BXY3_LUCCU|nr:hypothetical protein CVS40_0774 [Lucilia cuprina]KNC24870.1 hypothetical protein FF38_07858 [Lucilia cuprina]
MFIISISHYNCELNNIIKRSRTYVDIAKVINPNPYAHVGGRPFPAQPFWPMLKNKMETLDEETQMYMSI